MKEHPIIFSAEMVRAILRGDKTQTRRVVKVPPPLTKLMNQQPTGYCVIPLPTGEWVFEKAKGHSVLRAGEPFRCPYGVAGDRLWVREAWAENHPVLDNRFSYRADSKAPNIRKWKPSIHMPRWASRLTLEIVNVRVERLQDISEADARAEGYPVVPSPETLTKEGMKWMKPRDWFFSAWGRINDKRGYGWDKNPFVWVIEFKRI